MAGGQITLCMEFWLYTTSSDPCNARERLSAHLADEDETAVQGLYLLSFGTAHTRVLTYNTFFHPIFCLPLQLSSSAEEPLQGDSVLSLHPLTTGNMFWRNINEKNSFKVRLDMGHVGNHFSQWKSFWTSPKVQEFLTSVGCFSWNCYKLSEQFSTCKRRFLIYTWKCVLGCKHAYCKNIPIHMWINIIMQIHDSNYT